MKNKIILFITKQFNKINYFFKEVELYNNSSNTLMVLEDLSLLKNFYLYLRNNRWQFFNIYNSVIYILLYYKRIPNIIINNTTNKLIPSDLSIYNWFNILNNIINYLNIYKFNLFHLNIFLYNYKSVILMLKNIITVIFVCLNLSTSIITLRLGTASFFDLMSTPIFYYCCYRTIKYLCKKIYNDPFALYRTYSDIYNDTKNVYNFYSKQKYYF